MANDLKSDACTTTDVAASKSSGSEVGVELANESEQPMKVAEETVEFKVIFNKKKFDISFPLDATIGQLKHHLQPIIEIPPAMMKVMFKGLAKDEITLRKLSVSKGCKVMVVGSSLNDVLKVTSKELLTPASSVSSSSTPLVSKEASKDTGPKALSTCHQKLHKKVLDQGKPEDVMPGLKEGQEDLPHIPLSGMLNKHGGKVRLTFKLELDQLWIGTKERTEKVPLNSIKSVISEPIDDYPEYHILALQLGPTEASRYWIYWVPAQYVEAIKDCILGKWSFF